MMERLFLGVDIGGTNTKYGFIKASGEVLSSHKIPTNSKIPFEDYAKDLVADVNKNFQQYKNAHKLQAVGVGAPNGNGTNGYIENPPNLGWDKVDLVGEFEQAFSLPVKIENDANIAAVGEKRFGRAKNLDNFMVITLGTGVGVGTYVNGKLYLGSHGVGSEAGHITVVPDGRPCNCGGRGHLECYASATGIKKSASEIFAREVHFREVNEKFHNNEAEYIKIVADSAKMLALGLADMATVLAPQEFILSGGVCVLGDNFLTMVNNFFGEYVYPPFKKHTRITMSDISTEYGAILGAASLVI